MYVPKIQINGVEVDRPNPDNGVGLQSSYQPNPIIEDYAQSAAEGNFNVRNIDPYVDWNEYEKVGITPNVFATEENVESIAAKNQSTLEKIGNTFVQLFGNEIALGITKSLFDLWDVGVAAISPSKSVGSYVDPVNAKLEEAMDFMRERFAVYKEHPEDYFSLNDVGWWANGIIQFGTTVSLLVPSIGLTGASGKVAKGVKGVTGLNKELSFVGNAVMKSKRMRALASAGKINRMGFINAVDDITTSTAQAFVSRTLENRQEAREVYKNMYESTLNELYEMDNDEFNKFLENNKGRGYENMSLEEIAKDVADTGALDTFAYDYAMLGMDALQYAGIGKLFSKKLFGKMAGREIKEMNKELIKGISSGGTEYLQQFGSNVLAKSTANAAKKGLSAATKSKMFILGMEAVGEGIEEGYQGIMTEIGETTSKRMIDPSIEYRGLDSYLRDPAIWEQAFWGSIGSLVFTGLGSAYNTIKKESYIKKNKDKLSDNDIELLRIGYEASRMKELESRIGKTDKVMKRLSMINDGLNPYKPIFDADGKPTGEYETLDDINKQLYKQRALDDYLLDLYAGAIRHNNGDLIVDFVNSKEFQTTMAKSLGNTEGNNVSNINILNRFNKLVTQYDDVMYALSNKYETKNPFAVMFTAEQIMNSAITRDMAEDMIKYEEGQLTKNDATSNRAKQYAIDVIHAEIKKVEREIKNTEILYAAGNNISKNVRDARIRQLKRYRDSLIKEVREQEGLSILDDFAEEINSLNISDETYNNIENALIEIRKKMPVDDTVNDEDNKHARYRAEFMVEKVKYDSFVPKLNKEYEEAYSDIAYSMDMGIANKLKQDFENVKEFILNSENPIEAYDKIMRQDKDFMDSIDGNIRDSIYALRLGSDIFSNNPKDIFAGSPTNKFKSKDRELLYMLAHEKQKENDRQGDTKSDTTPLTEEQEKDEVITNPEQVQKSDEPLPTPKSAPKSAPKKEEKKEEKREEKKSETKKEKSKRDNVVFIPSTGEEVIIDDDYIINEENPVIDDQSYVTYVASMTTQHLAEKRMQQDIIDAYNKLDKTAKETLLQTDNYENTPAYTNLMKDLMTLSNNYNLFTDIRDESVRKNAINNFIKSYLNSIIKIRKTTPAEAIEKSRINRSMQETISAVDAAINAYSASGTIGENVTEENATEENKTPVITKDINSQIEQLITNYIKTRKIITIKDKDGRTLIDTVSLLKTILFVEKEGINYEDKSLVFQEIYRYIQESTYNKEKTEYSFYNSNIIYYTENRKKVFKDTVTLMNDLINDRYVEVRDRMNTMDSIMRVSGTTAFSEEEIKQKNAIISKLINNPKEWDNVSIIKDGTTIKFLYKNKIEIGFLQEVAKDDTNNILYKVKNIFWNGRMLNNKGFIFDIDSNNKAKIVDDYFHALINAASGLSNDTDARQLFDILIKQNISRNTNNAILDYMKDEDINIAMSVLNNGLIKNLKIGDMDGGDAYYGAVDVQLDDTRIKVKVVHNSGDSFNFVYYTREGNKIIITSEDKYRYNRVAIAVANAIIQDTNVILLHNYSKIKSSSEVYEDSMEYTYESLIASYETFKEINYRNMKQQILLQDKLINLKEGEKVDFEVLGFEGERLKLDAEQPAEFHEVRTSINPINNPIVIQTSAGVVTESGTTLSYISPNVHSSDIGILLSDVNNIMNPQILWLSNNDMNYLYNEDTPIDTNDTSKRQLADAVKTEIHNLLYTYLVGEDGNASTKLDSSRFEEFTAKLSSLLGGRNSSRGGLFTGVDIIRKWNNEKGGSIAIKFDNEEIVKDENGEYNYEVVIITGAQNSTIREPRIILRDENGKKSYALKANIDSLAQLILNHIKFNKSHFTFKNTDGNVGNETDYWYKKDGKLHINIGKYKPVYDNYGAFLMNNNAAKLKLARDEQGNIIKLVIPDSGRTPSFTINFGEFITKQRIGSPVEGEHTYDRTAIDELLNKDKEEGIVSVRELLENTDTNDEYIDMLFGKNSYNVKILADTVRYDKDGIHYARYDKDTDTIYLHKNMFDDADGDSNPSAFIRRNIIHENIHRMIKYNKIRYDNKLINDLLDTFKATIEALAKDDSKFGKSIKKGMDDTFHIVYDENGNLDIDKTINKFIKDIYGENNNFSKNKAVTTFVEEWLVESITQSHLISYLADTKFVLNGEEIEVKDTKKSQSIFQKIVDVLLKLFGIDLQDREKNSIFAQQYKLLNSMNPDAIDGTRKSTRRTTRKKSDNKSKKETTTKRGRKKKEEVKDNIQTEIQFTDDANVDNNEVKEGTNTEEGTVVAVPADDADGNTPEIFDPDNMYNDYTRDDNNDDADYGANDDEGSLYSNSKDILFSDEEIIINNYANNPTYNPNGVVTVSKMDDYLSMFPIEERALVAQNLENGNVNYVCR